MNFFPGVSIYSFVFGTDIANIDLDPNWRMEIFHRGGAAEKEAFIHESQPHSDDSQVVYNLYFDISDKLQAVTLLSDENISYEGVRIFDITYDRMCNNGLPR